MNQKNTAELVKMSSQIKRMQKKLRSAANLHRSRVIGMDIYIQDSEPQIEGDYLWIDTKGIDLISN